jgi:hypothetical protein
MTIQQETELLKAQWSAQGWTEGEIESSLIAYFEDSPSFVDDDGEE